MPNCPPTSWRIKSMPSSTANQATFFTLCELRRPQIVSIGSAPVVGVDADVAVRQVAGPYGRAAVSEAEVGADAHLQTFEMCRDGRFVIAVDGQALFRNPMVAEADREPVAVGGVARPAPRPHH